MAARLFTAAARAGTRHSLVARPFTPLRLPSAAGRQLRLCGKQPNTPTELEQEEEFCEMVDVMFEEKDMAKAVWQDLPPDVRAKFMDVAEDRLEFGKQHSYVKKPTKHQMLRLAFLAGLPMIGFGFMDNAIMIIAGDYLDTQLCVHLGLTTLFAAAIGNVFSDVAGVATAGPIESIIRNMGIRGPGMTPGQMRLPIVMVTKYIGTALGVTVGCILGMFPLLWPKEYRLWPSRDEVQETLTQDEGA